MMPMVSGLTFMLSDILGVWQVSVSYDGDHIRGSPFNIHVYDPNSVKVYGLEGGTVGSGLAFNGESHWLLQKA